MARSQLSRTFTQRCAASLDKSFLSIICHIGLYIAFDAVKIVQTRRSTVMRNTHIEVRSIAAAALMCMATSAIASPVIYASADPATSKGTELYIIDPIAATVTRIKGIGIGTGGMGTYGGSYGGGGYANSSSTGAGDTSGGVAEANLSPVSVGSIGESRLGGAVPLGVNSPDDAITAAELVTPSGGAPDVVQQRASVRSSDSPPALTFGGSGSRLAGTSGAQSSPRGSCSDDCDDLTQATVPAPSLLSQCAGSCGGEVSPRAQGALQISAVPEPSLLGLLGIGFASVGLARRRKTSTR
jgi:hypothetical protein